MRPRAAWCPGWPDHGEDLSVALGGQGVRQVQGGPGRVERCSHRVASQVRLRVERDALAAQTEHAIHVLGRVNRQQLVAAGFAPAALDGVSSSVETSDNLLHPGSGLGVVGAGIVKMGARAK